MNELNTVEIEKEVIPESGTGSGVSESLPASGQQTAQPPVKEDILDYTKDERSKTMWLDKATKAFNLNLMYKSYKNAEDLIEKQYKPLRAQADAFQSIFKEFGFQADANEIRQALNELKILKDPEHPVMKLGNWVQAFANDPEFGPGLTEYFETLRKKGIRREFGEGLSDEMVKEIVDGRTFREEMQAKEYQQKLKADSDNYLKEINDGWDKVTKEAKAIGFPIDDALKVKVMTEFAKLGVPPKFVYHQFMEMYKDEIEKYKKAKIQSEIKQTRINQHKSGIIPGSSKLSTGTGHIVSGGQKQNKTPLLQRVMDNLGIKT